ncbi:MAG: glycosyltransferase [Verrucomicrobia bacterium]|nr:MAG: glycosyltransferase [Verrucomicrobiota bacterium]TAF25851.1 MAG: glycosyltransferase [Verrucomicrobiota bacterium]
MSRIQDFEAFLLPADLPRWHVVRQGRASIMLPGSTAGAGRTFELYRPQRTLARVTAGLLRGAIATGLYRSLFRRVNGIPGAMGAGRVRWDFGYDPETVGILLGSPDHRVRRAIASYRGAGEWEVSKLGHGEAARLMLRREAAVLRELAAGGFPAPLCLGLHEQGEMTILRMPSVAGGGDSEVGFSEALGMLDHWVGDETPRSIVDFAEWESIRAALESTSDGRAALESLKGFLLRPSVSHGDFAPWNLLRSSCGKVMAIDWEWGRMDGMPGLDLVHYLTQEARLIHRLESRMALRAIEARLRSPEVALYLDHTGWGAHGMAAVLACAAYKEGAKHQKNSGFLNACIRKYFELQINFKRYNGVVMNLADAVPSAPHFLGATSPSDFGPSGGKKRIRISVVTASFRQIDHLRGCAASIQDQAGDFEVEHLIHDGGSGPEFEAWASRQEGALCVSERDEGMYDAINRGFRKSSGDLVAWLNCDEQYLPGALARVACYFEAHPDTDILFGDVILVDEAMQPLAYRRAVMPSLGHIRHSHLSTFSAATFVRRRVLDDGHYLQTRWKTIADAVWIEELLEAGYSAATLSEPLAIFGMLGSNLGQSTLLFRERRVWEAELGATGVWWKKWHILWYRMARLKAGAYLPRQARVAAYPLGQPQRRSQSRWVSGQWSFAKSDAEELRLWRDGAIEGFAKRPQRRRWTFLHAACFLTAAFFVDRLAEGDAVKGPFILLLSLFFLSFWTRLGDLIKIAVIYFVAAGYLLSERPPDVLVVRLGTFTLGAVLAVFWAASLRNIEDWMRGTVALIRRIPGPMILCDRFGKIILVNHSACFGLGRDEEGLIGRELCALQVGSDGRESPAEPVRDWVERPPVGLLKLALACELDEPLASAKVLVVGRGRYRFYAFTLVGWEVEDSKG